MLRAENKTIAISALLTLALLFFIGCQREGYPNNNATVVSITPGHQQVKSVPQESDAMKKAKLDAQTQKELAKIEMEKELALQQQRLESQRSVEDKKHALALSQQQQRTKESDNDFSFNLYMLLVALTIIIALFIMLYFIYRSYRNSKVKMHKDELEKEVYLKEIELKTQMAQKVFDTIASGKLTDEQESKLIEAFGKTPDHGSKKLLE